MSRPIREYHYPKQAVLVALLISLITFATIKLGLPASPWHFIWMVILPVALGIAFNRGAVRWLMAPLLLAVSLIAAMVIGNAMGGI